MCHGYCTHASDQHATSHAPKVFFFPWWELGGGRGIFRYAPTYASLFCLRQLTPNLQHQVITRPLRHFLRFLVCSKRPLIPWSVFANCMAGIEHAWHSRCLRVVKNFTHMFAYSYVPLHTHSAHTVASRTPRKCARVRIYRWFSAKDWP
jgi:hypothetical protein